MRGAQAHTWWAGTTESSAEASSRRVLDPDEEARLRSLGYLQGDVRRDGTADGPLVDPKDGIKESRALDAARDLLRAGDAAGALHALDPILAANPNNHQLIAISQTGDPTGAYYLYDFMMPNNKFNDYPKFGVWSDAPRSPSRRRCIP